MTTGILVRSIVTATAVDHASSLTVFLDGRSYAFGLPDRLAADAEDDAVSDRVMSPMPGIIKTVTARAGSDVTRGQPLAVIRPAAGPLGVTEP